MYVLRGCTLYNLTQGECPASRWMGAPPFKGRGATHQN